MDMEVQMTSTTSIDQKSVCLAMVKAATLAPSPDNNQPWLFQVTDRGIAIFLDKSRSLPSDVQSMFDLTGIGAAIENAVIVAAEHGLDSKVFLAREDNGSHHGRQAIAELHLTQGGERDPLFPAIPLRCTCRKPYSSEPLPVDVLNQLNASCERFSDVRIDWLTRSDEKKRFGKLIAATDGLRFMHRPFHEELFRQLRFRKSEVNQTNDGLDVRTLELPFGVTTMLGWLRSWNVMKMVHQMKLTSLLTIPSAISVQKSGALAIISVPAATTEAFVTGGRAIERLWLAGTSLGLSMHPLGSLPIFLLQPDPPKSFRAAIERARSGVDGLLPRFGDRVIQLGFRVGYSKPPNARSLRRPLSDMLVR